MSLMMMMNLPQPLSGDKTSPVAFSSLTTRHAATRRVVASWPQPPCFGCNIRDSVNKSSVTLRFLVALGLLQIGRGANMGGGQKRDK